MLHIVHLTEHVVSQLAVDVGAAVLVEVRLCPFAVRVVDCAGEFGIVEIKQVRPEPDNRAVLLVQLLHARRIVSRYGQAEPVDIGPSYQ